MVWETLIGRDYLLIGFPDAVAVDEQTLVGRLQSDSPADYPESGLDTVQLVNLPVWTCENGHEEFQIPAVEQLHRLLINMIIRKPAAVAGTEIRFLRKELGLSAKQFAERIFLTPEHLSRLETGDRTIQRRTDLLVRLYIAGAVSVRDDQPLPADLEHHVSQLERAWDIGSHRLRHSDTVPASQQWKSAVA